MYTLYLAPCTLHSRYLTSEALPNIGLSDAAFLDGGKVFGIDVGSFEDGVVRLGRAPALRLRLEHQQREGQGGGAQAPQGRDHIVQAR